MSVKITQPIPPNVVEIGNEISQGVVDGLMSASPSPSSSNPYLTVNGASSYYLPLTGGTMASGAAINFPDTVGGYASNFTFGRFTDLYYSEVSGLKIYSNNENGVINGYISPFELRFWYGDEDFQLAPNNYAVNYGGAFFKGFNKEAYLSTYYGAMFLKDENGLQLRVDTDSIYCYDSVNDLDKWGFGSSGALFPDGTIQTTAAVTPDLTPYLQKSDNLASLTSSSNARTNLGLGSMAVETASNYLTTATAASVYTTKANNLSDLTSASTARTNLGLAYATDAQVIEGTSASTVLTPSSSQQLLDVNTYGSYQISGFSWTSVTAGTGGTTYQALPPNKEVQVTTAIGSSLLYANLYSGSRGRLVSQGADWSKKNSFSIRIARNNTPATNTIFRCYLSHKSMATKALDARGIGFIIDGSGNIVIHAHNGTGLSTGTTTFASVNSLTDIKIESDGLGTTTCFVNGTSVGTCSGSPTTNAGNQIYFNIELENTSVQSASQIYYAAYAKIDLA